MGGSDILGLTLSRAALAAGLFAAVAAALAAGACADTGIGPITITGDQTWDSAGSPYYVAGNITVDPNVTLTLEGPLQLLFVGNYTVHIAGTLVVDGALGTVFFGLPLNATAPTWGGVFGAPNATLRVDRALFNETPSALLCDRCAEVKVTNSTFTRAPGAATSFLLPGSLVLVNLQFNNVSTAIEVQGCTSPTFTNISIVNAHYGIVLQNVSGATLEKARIRADETGFQTANVSSLAASGLDVLAPYGVLLFASSQVLLEDPLIGGAFPLSVWGVSSAITIDGAVIYGPGDTGIGIAQSDGVRVTNSRISGMSWAGIEASGTGLFIANTTISGGSYGVSLSNTLSSWLEGLLITDVNQGIYAVTTAWGTLVHNSVVACRNSPIVLYQANNWSVHDNNFVSPGSPARSLYGDNNSWDDGASGNFWFPNAFADADGDGFGDAPFNVTGGDEADRFPRMEAWTAQPFSLRLAAPPFAPEDAPVAVALVSSDPLGEWDIAWTFECGGKLDALLNFVASITFLHPGTCRITAEVTNLAGQTVNASAIVVVRDITAPFIRLDVPHGTQTGDSITVGSGNTTDNDPFFPFGATIAWNVTDPEGVVATYYGVLGNYSFAPQLPGTYHVEAIVTDAAGNVGRVTATFVVLDVTAPTVTAAAVFTIGEDALSPLGPIEVRDDDPRFAEAPAVSWIILTRVGELRAYGVFPSVEVADPGVFDVNITACDASMNCLSVAAQLIVLDKTAPYGFTPGPLVVAAGYPSPLNTVWVQDNQENWPQGATFAWHFDLPTGSVNLTGGAANLTIATPGVYYGTLRAQDAAGNGLTFAVSVLAYDGTAPLLRASVSPDAQPREPVNFSAADSTDEASPVFATWSFGDGTPDAAGLEVGHTFLGEGEFTVRLEVRDLAGNANRTVLHVRVRDTHNPTLRILSPTLENGTVHCVVGETLELRAEAQDASPALQVQWSFTSGGGADGTAAAFACSKVGTVRVRVLARDGSGNENLTSFDIVVEPRPGDAIVWPAIGLGAAGAGVGAALLFVRRRRSLVPKQ